MISFYDVLPTLCEAAAVAPPTNRNLTGRSFLAIAKRDPLPKNQPWRNLVFAQLRNTWMARDARYKLVMRNEGQGPNELFDIVIDPRREDESVRGSAVQQRAAPFDQGTGSVEKARSLARARQRRSGDDEQQVERAGANQGGSNIQGRQAGAIAVLHLEPRPLASLFFLPVPVAWIRTRLHVREISDYIGAFSAILQIYDEVCDHRFADKHFVCFTLIFVDHLNRMPASWQ